MIRPPRLAFIFPVPAVDKSKLKDISKAPTIRTIARRLGLSPATVSCAFRDELRVRKETRARILAEAEAVGYKYNPAVGTFISMMRRPRNPVFRGSIAIVDIDGPARRTPGEARYHRELARSASLRAGELGYSADIFVLGRDAADIQHLNKIFITRNIQGALWLPFKGGVALDTFDWNRRASIYTDCAIGYPAIGCISPDHYGAMFTALARLRGHGYRRPGLVIDKDHDGRLFHQWTSSYWACLNYHDKPASIPVLHETGRTRFAKWFLKHQPDVVLSHSADVIGWMRECGADIPRSHGFCCLNKTMCPDVECAGLDLQPRLLGMRAIDMITTQIFGGHYAAPIEPVFTTIPAKWIHGPTVRVPPSRAQKETTISCGCSSSGISGKIPYMGDGCAS